MIDQDDRAMLLDEGRWPGAFCCIKHKDFSFANGDMNKGVGVVLAVKDREKGEVAALLDYNIYMPLDGAKDKVQTMNVDDLLGQGWYVD